MGMEKDTAARLLKQMMHIRYFEDKIMELLAKNIAEGGSHLYAGSEAIAVGAMAALRKDDLITSTHRGHGHAVAKDGDLKALMAEILGKKTGCCKGKGGSLHLADLSKGNLGANGVVGGSVGMAAGAGLSLKMQKTDRVCVCFFGDGAANEGLFYESLNLAALWKLPVVYVCENNLYGMSVAVHRASAVTDLSKKALAFDMPSENVDGMDVEAVLDAVSRRVAEARAGKGPSLVVCNSYRYYGHSRSDPRAYRTREEEKFWRERDPIVLFSKKMVQQGVLSETEAAALDEEARKDIEDATDFAVNSPLPEESELYTDLYV